MKMQLCEISCGSISNIIAKPSAKKVSVILWFHLLKCHTKFYFVCLYQSKLCRVCVCTIDFKSRANKKNTCSIPWSICVWLTAVKDECCCNHWLLFGVSNHFNKSFCKIVWKKGNGLSKTMVVLFATVWKLAVKKSLVNLVNMLYQLSSPEKSSHSCLWLEILQLA